MPAQSVLKIAVTLTITVFGFSAAANAGGCGRGYGGYGGGYSSYQSQPSARYAAQVRAKKLAAARAAAAASQRQATLAQSRVAKKAATAAKVTDIKVSNDTSLKPAPVVVAANTGAEKSAETVAATAAPPKCYRYFPSIGERVEVACDTAKSGQ